MTGVCRICGHSFSSWNKWETICPKCRDKENLDIDITCPVSPNTMNYYYPLDNITTVSANNNDFTSLIIMAQKIVLENGGVQLVIDNDTIKSINTIEVNGIRFIKSGDCNEEM